MKISVNGKDYESWDDVPQDVREVVERTGAFGDAAHDGVPDVFERLDGPGSTTVRSMSVTVEGQTYGSLDAVPPEIRALLQSAGLLPDPAAGSVPAASTTTTAEGVQDAAAPAAFPQEPQDDVLVNGVPLSQVEQDSRKRWWQVWKA